MFYASLCPKVSFLDRFSLRVLEQRDILFTYKHVPSCLCQRERERALVFLSLGVGCQLKADETEAVPNWPPSALRRLTFCQEHALFSKSSRFLSPSVRAIGLEENSFLQFVSTKLCDIIASDSENKIFFLFFFQKR